MSARWETVEQVAARTNQSVRWVHERTRNRELPCRRLPGSRRILFVPEEVDAFIDAGGTQELEVIEGQRGGFVVRPKETAA